MHLWLWQNTDVVGLRVDWGLIVKTILILVREMFFFIILFVLYLAVRVSGLGVSVGLTVCACVTSD